MYSEQVPAMQKAFYLGPDLPVLMRKDRLKKPDNLHFVSQGSIQASFTLYKRYMMNT